MYDTHTELKPNMNPNTIGHELIKTYNIVDNISTGYINYMLKIFNDKNIAFERKILGIGNYQLNDVNMIDEKYRLLALGSLVFNMNFLNTKISDN